ncbi:MAG: LysM peptidoglycan-binding domain-containing protein [Bacteroidia bacterium]|nr:LysM peptidoglycan-binding domain-containing protein [Bacteroidia bacterium]
MSLQDKYASVLKIGEEIGVADGYVKEEDGKLKIGGTTNTEYEKNQMWNEIKRINGGIPSDLDAEINVATTEYYHKHTVQKGESLSLIAKHYYEDAMKYKKIFEANTNILKDPNVIHPGQELVIPFL